MPKLASILLMFGVGLHFHVKELLAVRKVAVPGAILQIVVATALGVALATYFGWRLEAGIVFGLALAVASTVVLLRVLADHDALHTPSGHVAVGWLLVEDLFTVFVLVILPVLVGEKGSPRVLWTAIGTATVKIAALVAIVLVAGQRVVPAILGYVARTRLRELFTLSVLVVVLGIAVGAAELFGASMALGAFLAGMVVGQSEFSSRAASEALPMRDAFAVLFFVSVGMLFDPFEGIGERDAHRGRDRHHPRRQTHCRVRRRASAAAPSEDGGFGERGPRADRGVSVHPRRLGSAARCPARRRHADARRFVDRDDLDQPALVPVRRRQAAGA